MDNVCDFISMRFSKDCNWLDGNCFWFAYILSARFPHLSIYLLPIENHFIAGDGKVFYDWRGEITPEEKPVLFLEIKYDDPIWYERLVRDCIN